MSLTFILDNLRFALEQLGALAFFVAAWLAFSAFRQRRDLASGSWFFGFALLTIWHMMNAFGFEADLFIYAGYIIRAVGLLLLIISLSKGRPFQGVAMTAVLVLPSVTKAAIPFNIIGFIGVSIVALLACLRCIREKNRVDRPLALGFLFLSVTELFLLFSNQNPLVGFWLIAHSAEAIGYLLLAIWSQHYLRTHLKEEIILVFLTIALIVTTIVTLAFSTFIIARVEADTENNLSINAKVLNLAIEQLKKSALAEAKYLSDRSDIRSAIQSNDFAGLQRILSSSLESEDLGFIAVTGRDGAVILRAQAPTAKGDNLSGERAASSALAGNPLVTVEFGAGEGFSVRGAAPVISGGKIIGAVIAGFPLDNAMADNIKKITGLEMSIFNGSVLAATTALNPDGRTRDTGTQVTDETVLADVLRGGKSLTADTQFLSRAYIASYLPLHDADGKIVGMISSAEPQQDILNAAAATNRLTFLVVGLITLFCVPPVYFLAQKLLE